MRRGEIYMVDLGPGVGREASGVSPAVVISNDVSNLAPLLVVVLPAVDASDMTAKLGILVKGSESGLPNDIAVLAMQPRTLDPTRFTGGPVGMVPREQMQKISFALQVHLDLLNVPLPRS